MAGRAGVTGGGRAALFGFGITTVSMIALLHPASRLLEGAAVVSALIGLVFALTGLGIALGRTRVLLAAPVALGFIAFLTAAGTLILLDRAGLRGRIFYVTAGLLTTMIAAASSISLWRALPHGVPDRLTSSITDTSQRKV